MITKHFLKTLILFTGMIAIGLIGIFLLSYFDASGGEVGSVDAEVKDIAN